MFDYIIREGFKAVLNAMWELVSSVITTLGFGLTEFTDNLAIIPDSYALFQAMGFGFVILFILWQSFKALGAPIGIESDDPLKMLLRGLLAIFLIFNAKQLFDLGFKMLQPVYDVVIGLGTGDIPSVDVITGTQTSESSTFGDVILGSLTVLPQLILFGTLLIIIFFQLIKMLIELTERYILMGILAVTSPLGISTMTSKSTSNIFSAWFRMVVGQYIIYLVNIWILRVFLSAFEKMPSLTDVTWYIFMWAFLKVAQKLDTFMGKLGIEVGSVGGSLLEELMLAKPAIDKLGKAFSPVGGGKAGGLGGAGGVTGGLDSALQSNAEGKGGGFLGKAARAVGTAAQAFGNTKLGNGLFKMAKYSAPGLVGAGLAALYRRGAAGVQAARNMLPDNAKLGYKNWSKAAMGGIFGRNNSTAKKIASELNKSGGLEESSLNKLSRPMVAPKAMNGITHATDDPGVTRTLAQTLTDGKPIGDFDPGFLKEKDDNLQMTAYNGGLKWSYEKTENDKTEKYEGVMAVKGNNDAMKHVQDMRRQPGTSFGVKKTSVGEVYYASRKSVTPAKVDPSQSKKIIVASENQRLFD